MLICRCLTVPEEWKIRGPWRPVRMKRFTAMRMLLGGFAAMILLAGCGGGGGGSTSGVGAPGVSPAGPATVLAWDPPARFADNEPVDPYRDIDHYEVYAREDANFSDSDQPVMVIPAMTSVNSTRAPSASTGSIKKGRKPNLEFPLDNLT